MENLEKLFDPEFNLTGGILQFEIKGHDCSNLSGSEVYEFAERIKHSCNFLKENNYSISNMIISGKVYHIHFKKIGSDVGDKNA